MPQSSASELPKTLDEADDVMEVWEADTADEPAVAEQGMPHGVVGAASLSDSGQGNGKNYNSQT